MTVCTALLACVLPAMAVAAPGDRVNLATLNMAKDPAEFTAFNGLVYFSAETNLAGRQLWRTDGTAAGTYPVSVVNPAGGGLSPEELTVHAGYLYFAGRDSQHNWELWRVGVGGSVEKVDEINPDTGSNPQGLTSFGPYLYFAALGSGDGRELWLTEGTAATTDRVEDINPGPDSSSSPIIEGIFGGRLFFSADNGVDGRELWSIAAPGQSPQLVKDMNPGSGSSFPRDLTEFAGRLYLVADDGTQGDHLWRMASADAQPVSLGQFADVNPTQVSPRQLTAVGSYLFFTASTSSHGRELWRIVDGPAGTVNGLGPVLFDINTNSYNSSNPEELVGLGDHLYFTANDGAGRMLWRSDGTVSGTAKVPAAAGTDAVPANPENLFVFDQQLFFSGRTAANGREVWQGGEAGVRMTFDLVAGPGDGLVEVDSSQDQPGLPNFATIGSLLYFGGISGGVSVPWHFEPVGLTSGDGGPGPGPSGPDPGGPGGGTGGSGQPGATAPRLTLAGPLRQVARGPRAAVRVTASCSTTCSTRATGSVQVIRKVRRKGKLRNVRTNLKLLPARRAGARSNQRHALVLRLSPKNTRQLLRLLRSKTTRATARIKVTATSPGAPAAKPARRTVRLLLPARTRR